MKLRNKYFYMLIMFYVSANAFAQNIEQIYMKNGSIIKGYIAEQIPGKQITLQTEEATIVVNSDSLLNRITERIPSESLSQEWKEPVWLVWKLQKP